MPHFLAQGGVMIWAIVATSAVAVGVFLERLLQYHRDQINSTEFLNGVRNVLKRDNIVEALRKAWSAITPWRDNVAFPRRRPPIPSTLP